MSTAPPSSSIATISTSSSKDLVTKLYSLYNHKAPKVVQTASRLSSMAVVELHHHAKGILDAWDEQSKLLKGKLGVGRRQKLSSLKRFCSRRCNDLEEALENGDQEKQDDESLKEEHDMMKIMELL
ncbi:hypothetical protein BGX27_003642 [Mortierella sp. AM989]|nr:hypothetical protein BGX27_003642 [Mortierella sp. AM989]